MAEVLGASRIACVRAPDEGVAARETTTVRVTASSRGVEVELHAVNAERDELPADLVGFDVCLAWEVLEHLHEDPPYFFLQATRRLRTGGYLSLTTPNALWHYYTTAQIFGDNALGLQLQPDLPFATHWRLYSPREVAELSAQSGCVPLTLTTFLKTEPFSLKSSLFLRLVERMRRGSGNGTRTIGQHIYLLSRKEREGEYARPAWLFPRRQPQGGNRTCPAGGDSEIVVPNESGAPVSEETMARERRERQDARTIPAKLPRRDRLELTAYRLHHSALPLVCAPTAREWMDATDERYAYRCLPLLIANQSGWLILKAPADRMHLGRHRPTDPEYESVASTSAPPARRRRVTSAQGSSPGTFRTSSEHLPGTDLLVRGPANWPKDGVQALEGIVESDWASATFTMNWKITRPKRWIPIRSRRTGVHARAAAQGRARGVRYRHPQSREQSGAARRVQPLLRRPVGIPCPPARSRCTGRRQVAEAPTSKVTHRAPARGAITIRRF